MRNKKTGEIKFDPTWYTIPEFAHIVPVNFYHKEQESGPAAHPGRKNLHVLSRGEIGINQTQGVILRITADDYYKVYINGVFAGQGPAPAYPEAYYYNQIDLTPYVKEGKNLVAVHLYYQGLVNRVWNSGDGRLALAADVVIWQQRQETVRNLSWKYQITEAYTGETTGYDTQFLENFDSRLWDENWNRPEGGLKGEWSDMVPADWADYHLIPQPTKMLAVYEKQPCRIEKRAERSGEHTRACMENAALQPRSAQECAKGTFFIDAGQEITGALALTARGKAGQKIHIFYGEELNEDGSVRADMRCGCRYEEIWTLDEGICRLEPYDYKGFRYCMLFSEEDVEISDVKFVIRHYPFDDNLCVLETDDPVLEQIFALCKNTVKYGTQEGYLDCPTREKGQYLGDAVVAARSQVWLTGTTEMLRKCIGQFAETAKICPGLMAVAPGSLMQEIADYSLLWGELLLTDYQFTHDREYLASYYPTARRILDYFRRYQKEKGMLEQVSEKWNLVDWPENMRDDYEFALDRPVVGAGYHNVINALFVGAVRTLTEIEDILGYPVTYDWKKLRTAYQEMFYHPEKKLFADARDSDHTSVHANIYPLYFGLAPEEAVGNIADFLYKKGLLM